MNLLNQLEKRREVANVLVVVEVKVAGALEHHVHGLAQLVGPLGGDVGVGSVAAEVTLKEA